MHTHTWTWSSILYAHACMSTLNLHVSELYFVHVELAHIKTLDRNEIWERDLYHSTALVEAAKRLALSNIIGHGKVYGACYTSVQRHIIILRCIGAMRGGNSTWMRYSNIVATGASSSTKMNESWTMTNNTQIHAYNYVYRWTVKHASRVWRYDRK